MHWIIFKLSIILRSPQPGFIALFRLDIKPLNVHNRHHFANDSSKAAVFSGAVIMASWPVASA